MPFTLVLNMNLINVFKILLMKFQMQEEQEIWTKLMN
jgi:hypothetical protein